MQQIFDFPVTPRYSFDNFVVCSGNRAAVHFARQLVTGEGTENLLYIHGASGSGKTHLLHALGHSICEQASLPDIPYFTYKEIDAIYQGDYTAETASRLANIFRDAPVLLIDDIHLIPDIDSVRIELWQLFNDFYQAGKKIAMAGLMPPRELPHLDGHLVSRLLWGLVARVDISDDESRRMILDKLARDRQIRIPDEVFDYLVTHAPRDIPALIEALERLSRLSLATQRKVTLRLARESLVAGNG